MARRLIDHFRRLTGTVLGRDSKPEAFLLNPGFGFGKPQNPGFGSGSGLGKWRLSTSKTVNEIRHLCMVGSLVCCHNCC